jgi:hypothetical protein
LIAWPNRLTSTAMIALFFLSFPKIGSGRICAGRNQSIVNSMFAIIYLLGTFITPWLTPSVWGSAGFALRLSALLFASLPGTLAPLSI